MGGQLRGRKRAKAFLVLQSMGIVDLEDENAFAKLDEISRRYYIEKFKTPSFIQELSDAGVSIETELPENAKERSLIIKGKNQDKGDFYR